MVVYVKIYVALGTCQGFLIGPFNPPTALIRSTGYIAWYNELSLVVLDERKG